METDGVGLILYDQDTVPLQVLPCRWPGPTSRNSTLLSPLGNIGIAIWSLIGALASLSLIYAVNGQIPVFQNSRAPLILGSFGAAAVLEFGTIESPLAQPRNVVLGQLMGSLLGVAISKGLTNGIASQPQDLQWLAGALSCGCTMVAMGLTGTVHPPAGATALLAVTDDSVRQLGWMLVPMVMLSCALMLLVALFINNLQRTFPQYWWTPDDVGSFWARGHGEDEAGDCEQAKGATSFETRLFGSVDENHDAVVVTLAKNGLFVAPDVHLRPEEILCLEGLCRRLWP